ncbi:FtsX-like permease family protein [Piscinibacter sakaiensis]|uniref:FtsX-like permease family protein n=1 Tax=Piscinibacter sakaiensis TaxID=1547922 RepID=UPI000A753AE2
MRRSAAPRDGGARLGWQLAQLTWPEWRHAPWRHLAALAAVMLGVALAFAVHLVNASALSEFSAAVRSVNGKPDLELRAQREGFDETLYARVALHPQVRAASPVVEIDTVALDARGRRVALRVLGIDPLGAAAVTPDLLPRPGIGGAAPPDAGADRRRIFDPDAVALNAAARARLGLEGAAAPGGPPEVLRLLSGNGPVELRWTGRVAAGGPPLAVMDIAGAQARFGWLGRLSRLDVRLVPGADRARVLAELDLPPAVRAAAPDEAAERVSNVSRAYRVNLTVLALVALFTGAFLVFSILSLSVARRLPQLALLGVLGLSARARRRLVLAESLAIGATGSVLGLALGTALAALALRLLAGDLGGGYFPGVAPTLQFDALAAAVFGALGIAAAVVGGLGPARTAERLAPAQALKGLGSAPAPGRRQALPGLALLAAGTALAFAPPVGGLPIAAYVAVALLLLGGIVVVPAAVAALLAGLRPPRHPLALLAVERARHQRSAATIAIAGVVASLALSVALTVMVTSFREAVAEWLDTVLPADLYLRVAGAGAGDTLVLPPGIVQTLAAMPGVARVEAQRVTQVQWAPGRPTVALISRPLADPLRSLPLVGERAAVPAGEAAAWVSEAMVALYDARPGTRLALPLPDGRRVPVTVAGVWRDYARQSGAVLLAREDYERLSGDRRLNDLAIWLAPGAAPARVQDAVRARLPDAPGGAFEMASAGEIRALSLRIFDRSFAVTTWLQAIAIGIGLFGVAASFSAQVLARRKEFGLLAHLGLTRRQILALVAAEGAVWTAAGTVLGLLLGLAVAVVLVHVVNPQSFHWTMELRLPPGRLAALCGAVLAAGVLTAWLAGRAAVGRLPVVAVREDW